MALRRRAISGPERVLRSFDGLGSSPFSISSLASIGSIRSACSIGSIGSIASTGSVCSVVSAGSIGSIASTGSILSVASAGSILSINSAGKILCVGNRPITDPSARRWVVTAGLVLGSAMVAAVGVTARQIR